MKKHHISRLAHGQIVAFQESQHPRGAGGKFADKPGDETGGGGAAVSRGHSAGVTAQHTIRVLPPPPAEKGKQNWPKGGREGKRFALYKPGTSVDEAVASVQAAYARDPDILTAAQVSTGGVPKQVLRDLTWAHRRGLIAFDPPAGAGARPPAPPPAGKPPVEFTHNDDEETWNKVMKVDPGEFRDKMFAGVKGDVKVTASGVGSKKMALRFTITGADGEEIAHGTRNFARERDDNDNMVFKVDHTDLRIKKTGQGLGKQLLKNSIDTYSGMGIDKVTTRASAVGGYTWAKFGFKPEPKEWEGLRRAIGKGGEDPADIWKVADSPEGKSLLVGRSWNGALDLKDEASMARFNQYVGNAPAPAPKVVEPSGKVFEKRLDKQVDTTPVEKIDPAGVILTTGKSRQTTWTRYEGTSRQTNGVSAFMQKNGAKKGEKLLREDMAAGLITVRSKNPVTVVQQHYLDVADASVSTNLTPVEKNVINEWAGSHGAFRMMGPQLRKDLPLGEREARVMATMDSAIEKSSVSEDIAVFRGVSPEAKTTLLDNLKPGSVLADKSFTATSMDPDHATKFASDPNKGLVGAVMVMHVPKGTKAFMPGRLREFKTDENTGLDEAEVLFPRNQEFVFIEREGNRWHFEVAAPKSTPKVVEAAKVTPPVATVEPPLKVGAASTGTNAAFQAGVQEDLATILPKMGGAKFSSVNFYKTSAEVVEGGSKRVQASYDRSFKSLHFSEAAMSKLSPTTRGHVVAHEAAHGVYYQQTQIKQSDYQAAMQSDLQGMSEAQRRKYSYFSNRAEHFAEGTAYEVGPLAGSSDAVAFQKAFPGSTAKLREYLRMLGVSQ